MAYTLTYWASDRAPRQHYELRHVRLRSINEAFTLSLPHNRPSGTSLITLERHRNYKGQKWIEEKTVWEKGMDYPANVISRPKRTK